MHKSTSRSGLPLSIRSSWARSPARLPAGTLALAASLALAGTAGAQEEPPPLGWAGTGELSLLATQGNSETYSFGLRATATRTWEAAKLSLEGAALQAEQTRVDRRAVGPPDAPVLVEIERSETTADNLSLRGTYDHELARRLFAFGSAAWERDELAGIADRAAVAVGLGHVWADGETMESRTRYGIGYTWEEATSGLDDAYLNLRLEWSFRRLLTETTTFTSDLVVDENLDDTSDYRAVLLTALAVSMTDRLALKVSAEAKYDHEPARVAVPREFPAGVPTGDLALVALEDLDTVLSGAVVVTW